MHYYASDPPRNAEDALMGLNLLLEMGFTARTPNARGVGVLAYVIHFNRGLFGMLNDGRRAVLERLQELDAPFQRDMAVTAQVALERMHLHAPRTVGGQRAARLPDEVGLNIWSQLEGINSPHYTLPRSRQAEAKARRMAALANLNAAPRVGDH